ncbi:hypothetical protein ACFQV2_06165 [Actinokineospora soli]|uniref:PQQ-like domain-containing protein n=1 Tax=Actinokineospora soli TaxID=1048753 RepID=A0ABW2THX6_9PSEU
MAELAPPVLWATRAADAMVTTVRMACAGEVTVTAKVDGTVSWSATSNGNHLQQSSALGFEVVDLAVADVGPCLVTVAVTGDGGAHCWRGYEPVHIEAPAEVERVVAHESGLVAFATGHAVRVVDALTGETVDRTVPESIEGLAFTGVRDHPVLWIAGRRGRLWRWKPCTERNPTTARIGHPPLLLAASATAPGPAVLDVRGGVTGEVVGDLPDLDVRAAVLSDRWIAFGGGNRSDTGWVTVGTRGRGMPTKRLPLDGPPADLALVSDVLVIATGDGLAAVDLEPLRELEERRA